MRDQGQLRPPENANTIGRMSEMNTPTPDEEEDERLDDPADVDQLGGDADILESLPEDDPSSELDEEADDLDAQPDAIPIASDDSPFLTFRVDEVIEEVDVYESDPYGTLDIEAALAAVSSLSDEQAQREAAEAAAVASAADSERDAEPEAEIEPRPLASLKEPPPLTLRRGQLGSVIPALTLMGVGAWLTLALTSGATALTSPLLVFGVIGAVLVLILLAQWLASGRWTRGILFVAVFALLLVAALYEDMVASLGLAVPLTLAAFGGALLLTGLIGRPPDRRLFIPGVLLVVGSAIAAIVERGLLPGTLMTGIAPYWWVVAAVLVVIWLLPVVFGRRS